MQFTIRVGTKEGDLINFGPEKGLIIQDPKEAGHDEKWQKIEDCVFAFSVSNGLKGGAVSVNLENQDGERTKLGNWQSEEMPAVAIANKYFLLIDRQH